MQDFCFPGSYMVMYSIPKQQGGGIYAFDYHTAHFDYCLYMAYRQAKGAVVAIPDRHCPHAVVVYCHINLEAAALRRLLLN